MPRLKKHLGQHLLVDARALGDIAKAVGAGPEDVVLEIGPGTGNLTARLLESAGRVVAVELDPEMCERLKERFAGEERFDLIYENIMAVDLPALTRRVSPARPLRVVGNLPYYITTPILLRLLEHEGLFSNITLLVQEEVARRVAAEPGGGDYGALSVACQARAHCAMGPMVSRKSFRPVPKVDSAVICLTMLPPPDFGIEDMAVFEKVVRGAFEHRRKTCYNALRFSLGKGILKDFSDAVTPQSLKEAFQEAGVSPDSRPGAISLKQFARLAARIVVLERKNSE